MRRPRGPGLAIVGVVAAVVLGGTASPAVPDERAPASREPGAATWPGAEAGEIAALLRHANRVEVRLGELAQRKAVSPRVQRYGDRLARDHRFADRRVLAVAAQAGLAVDATPPAPEEQQLLARLEAAEGEAFDRAFLDALERRHDRTIALLDRAHDRLPPSELTDLIAALVPILRQHHDLAGRLQHELGRGR